MKKTRRKIKPIARKRHNYIYLLLAILFAILTGYIFLNFPPEFKFQFLNLKISIIPFFFISFSIFIFSLTTFLFIQRLHGILFVIFILGYISMRLVGLTHWIFLLLVVALFITAELFIIKKK